VVKGVLMVRSVMFVLILWILAGWNNAHLATIQTPKQAKSNQIIIDQVKSHQVKTN